MSEHPQDPLKSLWRSQQPETTTMSIEAIRAQGRALDRRMRLRTLWGLAVAVAAAALFAWMSATAPNGIVRAGFLIEILGTVVLAWLVGRRWPGEPPDGESSAVQLLDHQRGLLLRQRTTFLRVLAAAAPMLAGLVVMVAGLWVEAAQRGAAAIFLGNSAPLFVLLGAWFVALWVVWRRQSTRLRGEIEALDALRRG